MSDAELGKETHGGHDAGGHGGERAGKAPGKRSLTAKLPARQGEAMTFAAEKITGGLRDENKLTNEVFWWLQPALPRERLDAGTEEAAEWIQVRDHVARPALTKHETQRGAAPKADQHADNAREIGGSELARGGHAVVPRHEPVGPSGDALIDDLLARVPPQGSTNKVEAAWLLEALGTKLFGAFPQTIGQLTQLSRGETALRTSDGISGGDAIRRGVAELERQKIHTQHLGSEAGRMQYSVDDGHLPILAAMIDLASGRLREFVKGGMKDRRVLFTFGDMVRADVDFAKGGRHSDHTSGNAIDLAMNFNNEADLVGVLSTLPAGKIRQVFPDGGAGDIKAHVHLALADDGKYELGIPFAGAFFQLKDSVFSAQTAAKERAGGAKAEVGTRIKAEGLRMWHSVWYETTGEHLGGNNWNWTWKAKGLARPHIQSAKLKAVLDTLDSGSPRNVSVQAAKEDGVDPHEAKH